MSRRWGILGLSAIAVAVVATACAPSSQTPAGSFALASPAGSIAQVASASPSASSNASASPSASPTATPAPTPVPTPVPWKTYKSKRFKYQMNYPPDWIVTPGASNRSDQYDDSSSHYVYVFRDTVSTTVDLNGTVSREIALFKSHYKTKVLTNKVAHVGAYSGRIITMTGTNSGRKFYIQVLIIKRGAVGYFLEMWSDPGHEGADRKLFLRMYTSFKPQS